VILLSVFLRFTAFDYPFGILDLWHGIIYPVVGCDFCALFFLLQYNTLTVATNYGTSVKNITKIQYIDNVHA